MNENYLFYRNVFSGRKIPEDRFESYFSRGRDYINAKYGGIEAAEEIKNKSALEKSRSRRRRSGTEICRQ